MSCSVIASLPFPSCRVLPFPAHHCSPATPAAPYPDSRPRKQGSYGCFFCHDPDVGTDVRDRCSQAQDRETGEKGCALGTVGPSRPDPSAPLQPCCRPRSLQSINLCPQGTAGRAVEVWHERVYQLTGVRGVKFSRGDRPPRTTGKQQMARVLPYTSWRSGVNPSPT